MIINKTTSGVCVLLSFDDASSLLMSVKGEFSSETLASLSIEAVLSGATEQRPRRWACVSAADGVQPSPPEGRYEFQRKLQKLM